MPPPDPQLCPRHEAVVRLCIIAAPHLDVTERARLRTDYLRVCRPGEFWCPPLTPIETVREYR